MKKILIPAIIVVVLLVALLVAYPTIMKMMGESSASPETTVSDETPSTNTTTSIRVNGILYDVHTNGSASLMDWFNEYGKKAGYKIEGEKIYAPDGEHLVDTKGLALEDKLLQPDDEFLFMSETPEGYVPHVTPVDGVSDNTELNPEETTESISGTNEESEITEKPISENQEESTEKSTEEIVSDSEEIVESDSLASIGVAPED